MYFSSWWNLKKIPKLLSFDGNFSKMYRNVEIERLKWNCVLLFTTGGQTQKWIDSSGHTFYSHFENCIIRPRKKRNLSWKYNLWVRIVLISVLYSSHSANQGSTDQNRFVPDQDRKNFRNLRPVRKNFEIWDQTGPGSRTISKSWTETGPPKFWKSRTDSDQEWIPRANYELF